MRYFPFCPGELAMRTVLCRSFIRAVISDRGAAATLCGVLLFGVIGAAALAQEPAAGATSAPAPIVTRAISEVAVHPRREAPATVIPRNDSRIAAEVAARVLRIHADAGQSVRRGALLAELDDADFRLALAGLEAQRDALAARSGLAQQQLQRARELQQQGFVATEFVNQRDAEQRVLAAETQGLAVQIAAAQRQIDKTRVVAPFDAVVRQRGAQLGELATPGAVLFVLTETGALELSAAVAAADAGLVARAKALTFIAGADSYPVRLLRLSPVVSSATRTREGRFAFVGAAVLPGAEGTLRWDDPRAHLPAAALVRRDGRLGVFVHDDGIVHFVPVPDAQEGRAAATDLALATRIVVVGQATLRDGQSVELGR